MSLGHDPVYIALIALWFHIRHKSHKSLEQRVAYLETKAGINDLIDSNWIAEVDKRTSFNEGKELHIYKDSKGIPTIGIGYNMLRGDGLACMASIGADYHALLSGAVDLTEDQCSRLFAITMDPILDEVRALIPGFDKLADARRAALFDMAFNMGTGTDGLGGFTGTIALIEAALAAPLGSLRAHDLYATAAGHIRNSSYRNDVGDRALRNAEMIETSNWVPYNKQY